jgi:hypothetical protein
VITLASDCLVFQLATGESIPYSAEMVCSELAGEALRKADAEVVGHAAHAVFHYFKRDLGRQSVSETEFAEAMEKVLQGLELGSSGATDPAGAVDLGRLAEMAGGSELFFFPLLREEARRRLAANPRLAWFSGLRDCAKRLAGSRRWTPRCQELQERIVDFLRNSLRAEAGAREVSLLVE